MQNKPNSFREGNYVMSDGKHHRYSSANGVNIAAATKSVSKRSSGFKTFFSFLFKALHFLASIAGLLLLVFAAFQVKAFISKMQTVMELQSIVSNLKASMPIVQLSLVDAELEKQGNFSSKTLKKDGLKTFRLSYFNASGEIEEIVKDTVSIRGNNIYIDCDVYNFTYSLIEKGEAKNIAIPYRIYSDTVAPENGILLNPENSNKIPYMLIQTNELGSEDFYQLEADRIKKLMNIIQDPEQAKELGIIRSRQKAAVANYNDMKLSASYVVYVQNNGGITLKSK